MAEATFNPRATEGEAGRSLYVQGQPGLRASSSTGRATHRETHGISLGKKETAIYATAASQDIQLAFPEPFGILVEILLDQ